MATGELKEYHGRGVKVVYRNGDETKAQKGICMGESDLFLHIRTEQQQTVSIGKNSICRIVHT